MWLLFLLMGDTIWLESGKQLTCDSYQTVADRVVLQGDFATYSIPKDRVDWTRTQRGQNPTPTEILRDNTGTRIRPLTEPAEADYEVFMIQKLDVKQVSLIDLIRFLADMVGLNLYIDSSVKDTEVTYLFTNVPWDQVMTMVLYNAGLSWDLQTRDLLAVK